MSNYVEYKGQIAFHPGYYIGEAVQDSGLTQEDFAKRLDTTPKNLSILIRGEQSLSTDIALKLSRLMDTSVEYWLNLQKQYDAMCAEFRADKEMANEQDVFDNFDYGYFVTNFEIPDVEDNIDQQITYVRKFLNVSSLTVLTKRDMAVKFRSSSGELSESSTIRANAMVAIATNIALSRQASRYNKRKFEKAVEYALTLTENHAGFVPLLQAKFAEAGVIFEVLPNIEGSEINGATKRIGDHVMLMVNDRRCYADSFWFTLFHEIGHIMHGDYGISFDGDSGQQEKEADRYAESALVPDSEYADFARHGDFDISSIRKFSGSINRDPGIVLGRLENDGLVSNDDDSMKSLRHKYRVKVIYRT